MKDINNNQLFPILQEYLINPIQNKARNIEQELSDLKISIEQLRSQNRNYKLALIVLFLLVIVSILLIITK